MTGPRRRVDRGADFVAKAHSMFPAGGSTQGSPSFELFERLILRGVEEQFARQFDHMPEPIAGVAIRAAMTHAVPWFPALVVYGVLKSDGAVELVDLTIDDEYFELIGDDPTD